MSGVGTVDTRGALRVLLPVLERWTGFEEQYFIFSREMRGGEARANILTCFSTPDSLDKLTGTERGDGSQERDTLQIENGSKLVERYLGLISPNIVTGLI